jgi:hypothetical protein
MNISPHFRVLFIFECSNSCYATVVVVWGVIAIITGLSALISEGVSAGIVDNLAACLDTDTLEVYGNEDYAEAVFSCFAFDAWDAPQCTCTTRFSGKSFWEFPLRSP